MPVGNSSSNSFTRLFERVRLLVTHDDVSSELASLLCEKRGPLRLQSIFCGKSTQVNGSWEANVPEFLQDLAIVLGATGL